MNRNFFRILFIILLLLMYILIFFFSSQVGDESSKLSGGIVRKILYSIGLVDNMEVESVLEIIVRKMAHFSLYFVCGILAMCIMINYDVSNKFRILCSFCINLFYSISDEIHQMFVPGRTGKVTDVFIDSLGVICGILIIYVIIKVKEKYKRNIND